MVTFKKIEESKTGINCKAYFFSQIIEFLDYEIPYN